jgi:hypothetical protein
VGKLSLATISWKQHTSGWYWFIRSIISCLRSGCVLCSSISKCSTFQLITLMFAGCFIIVKFTGHLNANTWCIGFHASTIPSRLINMNFLFTKSQKIKKPIIIKRKYSVANVKSPMNQKCLGLNQDA